MSFGALSSTAISALNRGAKKGGFAHDTGEGGISRCHREGGGDLIYQVASGYFGCRNPDGTFSEEKFRNLSADPQIKMIDIKLSQGAKPGQFLNRSAKDQTLNRANFSTRTRLSAGPDPSGPAAAGAPAPVSCFPSDGTVAAL